MNGNNDLGEMGRVQEADAFPDHHHSINSHYTFTMAGFHPHMPATRYTAVAKILGASMWFWVMYKAKEEGPVVLVCQLGLDWNRERTFLAETTGEQHWITTMATPEVVLDKHIGHSTIPTSTL